MDRYAEFDVSLGRIIFVGTSRKPHARERCPAVLCDDFHQGAAVSHRLDGAGVSMARCEYGGHRDYVGGATSERTAMVEHDNG